MRYMTNMKDVAKKGALAGLATAVLYTSGCRTIPAVAGDLEQAFGTVRRMTEPIEKGADEHQRKSVLKDAQNEYQDAQKVIDRYFGNRVIQEE